LKKIEKTIPRVVDSDAAWGELAALRDDYLADQALDSDLHPGGQRDGADAALFAQQIDDAPATVQLPEMREGQCRCL